MRVPEVEPPKLDPLAWVAKAEEDMEVIDLIVAVVPGQAAYHLQQAVEKLLKAMIVNAKERPPHIHSLVPLREQVGSNLRWSVDLDWLARVSAWVSVTRYPDIGSIWPAPTASDVKQARIEALLLLAEVKQQVART